METQGERGARKRRERRAQSEARSHGNPGPCAAILKRKGEKCETVRTSPKNEGKEVKKGKKKTTKERNRFQLEHRCRDGEQEEKKSRERVSLASSVPEKNAR